MSEKRTLKIIEVGNGWYLKLGGEIAPNLPKKLILKKYKDVVKAVKLWKESDIIEPD